MKIIRPGKPPREAVLKGWCHSCGCEVEAEQGECCYQPSYDPPREEPYHYLPCPTAGCRAEIYMGEK